MVIKEGYIHTQRSIGMCFFMTNMVIFRVKESIGMKFSSTKDGRWNELTTKEKILSVIVTIEAIIIVICERITVWNY